MGNNNLKGEELLDHLTETITQKGYGLNMVKYDPNFNRIVWNGSFEEDKFEICYNRLILHGATLQPVKDRWGLTVCIINDLKAFENAVEDLEYINEPQNTSHIKTVQETYTLLDEQYHEFINWLKTDAEITDKTDLIDCVAKLQPIHLTKVYEDGVHIGYIGGEL